MEIREVRPEEHEETGRVTVAAYQEFVDPAVEGWDGYLRLLADVAGRAARTVVLVAVDGGRVIATATIELDDVVGDDDEALPADTSALRMLGVLPEARGRGVARALMDEVIGRVRAAGKRVLILRTTDLMAAAQALYASMGFERATELDIQVTENFTLLGFRLPLG